ncbi:hypothetical protein ACFWEH_17210 [Streptomyces anulatus]|uniref:hypothetical protein n=1 Tax=Streptomyces TaxID=1883 RepID=UPI00093AADC2|nr:hypothetical protein [Streptomyces sp. TSRI0395]OKI80085.1 hypothetical protein AMK12_15265 [Streptomyces sp. TSRI0395]
MMETRTRKKILIASSIATVTACLCVGALSVAQASPQTPLAERAAEDMPSIVEDFNYPGADRILAERNIKLKRGDGHITLVNCDTPWNIKVESRLDNSGYCFQATTKTGYLTLELPDAYGIWAEEHPVKATLTAEGKETVVNVPSNDYLPVGESTGLPSVLVELRVTG